MTAIISSCHGQAGRPAMIVRFGRLRGKDVDVARMRHVEDLSAAAGMAGAGAGIPDHHQHRPLATLRAMS